jgi:microcin C transport system permease protein
VAKVRRNEKNQVELIAPPGVDLSGWDVRLRTPDEAAARWRKWMDTPLSKPAAYRAVLFRPRLDGLLQGSLGHSSKYQDLVWSMIFQRMPVSLFYGLISMVIIYGICLPLGILKAIKHRTWLDNATSFAVFAGYAIPGYALGSLLVVFLGAKLGWFPIRGFTGDDFDTLSPMGKVKDLFLHAAMPLTCYLVGSFAFMTLLVKNSLMDNLAADYVRTAVAKGVSYPSAVFRHAFRNSIIPVASTFGGNITLLVAGSMLIEKVFDINGFGLLQFNAILERDEPLMMGVLFVSATLMLIGNVLSDLCVALVDPRVSYQ